MFLQPDGFIVVKCWKTTFSYILCLITGNKQVVLFHQRSFSVVPNAESFDKTTKMAEDQFKITEESCPRLVILVRAAASWPGFSMISFFLSVNTVVFFWTTCDTIGVSSRLTSSILLKFCCSHTCSIFPLHLLFFNINHSGDCMLYAHVTLCRPRSEALMILVSPPGWK